MTHAKCMGNECRNLVTGYCSELATGWEVRHGAVMEDRE